MPFCPTCKYEYVKGIRECPDCYVELVDQLCEETVTVNKPHDEELVSVFTSSDPMEIAIVKDMLQASGVPVLEQSDTSMYTRHLTFARPGTDIYTFKSQADEAVRLIEQSIIESENAAQMDEV